MARRKRVRDGSARSEGGSEQPVDVGQISQGVGNFETINGMPQGIVAAALVMFAVILIRPISRALRAFLRG